MAPSCGSTKQIPVERSTTGANRSLQLAKEIVNEGGAIIIYPEGTLTRDPALWPMKGHTGAARMALESGIPVVPIAHWGAQEVFPRYAKRFYIFPRKTSRLVVGDPVDLSAFAGPPAGQGDARPQPRMPSWTPSPASWRDCAENSRPRSAGTRRRTTSPRTAAIDPDGTA